MVNSKPIVSVLIPLYNAEKYIGKTLESVLNQTYQNFEIIVVNDGSIDHSLEIVGNYKDERIKIICNKKNMGIAYSRNLGLKHCNGEYVALLDHDDIALGTRLEKQVRFLEENPHIGAVGGNAQWIDENDNVIRGTIDVVTDPLDIRMFFMFRNIFNNSEMTFRKFVVEKHNITYSDGCFGLEDFLFWIKFSKVEKMSNLPDLVLKKRMTAENETAHMREEKSRERKEKYLELQKYSFALDGIVLEQADEWIMGKFFAEAPYVCKNTKELQLLSDFLKKIVLRAEDKKLSVYVPMARWFEDILRWNLENMKLDYLADWKRAIGNTEETSKMHSWFTQDLLTLIGWNRQFAKRERYIRDLEEAKGWLEQQNKEQEQYAQDLLEAKEWLERHCEDQEQYIRDLEEARDWLEQHGKEQEQYVQDLLKTKKWLERHGEEQEQYIRDLQKEKIG